MDFFSRISDLGAWAQQHPTAALWGVGGALALAGVAKLFGRRSSQQTTHGSARWATQREIHKAGLYSGKGVILGRVGTLLQHDGPEHILLIGPTRSGKGISTIIPTLLTWPESVLVLDPKDGENYDVTKDWRAQYTTVYAFTPCKRPQTRINVLDMIRLTTLHEVGDVQVIAQSLVAPEKMSRAGEKERHFIELAGMLLTAAILHVCYTSRRKSLAGVWDFLTQQHASLGESLKAMVTTAHTVKGVHTAIVSMTRAIQNITGDRELSSVWSTAIRPLALYSDPLIAASTDSSDLSLETLQYGKYPVSLYLIAPSPMALERLHPVYRVILDVGMTRLMERKVRTWRYRLLNCLDELPWHGYCRAVDKGIAVQAGYGQKNLVVTQDLDALFDTFGLHTPIMGNCHVKIIHTPDNDLTAKRISENLLGRSTVESTGQSISQGRGRGRTTSTHSVGRPLLTTDEVMDLPADKEILRIGGLKPILADKVNYRTDKDFAHRRHYATVG